MRSAMTMREFFKPYWDLPDEMQRKMLANVTSNRPALQTFEQLQAWANRKHKVERPILVNGQLMRYV